MKKLENQKVIVSFNYDDFRKKNHSESLFFRLTVQFILSEKNNRAIQDHSFLKEPLFLNNALLTHYEDDIERLNRFYSIFDFSVDGQLDKVLEYFLNEKFEKYKPYSFEEDNLLNAKYFFVYVRSYPCIGISFVENHFYDINEKNQTYTTQDSKRVFKIGNSYERSHDNYGKQGIFSRNDKNQIEKIFKFETWFKN